MASTELGPSLQFLDSREQWKRIWRCGKSPVQLPGWGWEQLALQHTRSLGQIPSGLSVVTVPALLGEYAALGEDVVHLPVLGCLHRETAENFGNVPLCGEGIHLLLETLHLRGNKKNKYFKSNFFYPLNSQSQSRGFILN